MEQVVKNKSADKNTFIKRREIIEFDLSKPPKGGIIRMRLKHHGSLKLTFKDRLIEVKYPDRISLKGFKMKIPENHDLVFLDAGKKNNQANKVRIFYRGPEFEFRKYLYDNGYTPRFLRELHMITSQAKILDDLKDWHLEPHFISGKNYAFIFFEEQYDPNDKTSHKHAKKGKIHLDPAFYWYTPKADFKAIANRVENLITSFSKNQAFTK